MDLHGPKPEVAMHILGINSCLSFEHPPELDACLRTPSWSLSGEMSDQLKCKHLQLPSQNGQLFETNQERTRTKFFRSFPLRACDALNRDSKPWTTCVWRVPLRRTKRAALRCQLPQFVVCRSFSLMFCECTFLFSEFTVLRLGASPPFCQMRN